MMHWNRSPLVRRHNMHRWLSAWLAAGLVVAMTEVVSAQPVPPSDQAPQAQPERKAKTPRGRAVQPDLDDSDQLSPRQLDQRGPARPARGTNPSASPEQAAAAQPRGAEPPRTIARSEERRVGKGGRRERQEQR